MKIVFMGTPDFAAGALKALIAAGHEITAVVTQPDKAKGRSNKLMFTPVKECALAYNIPIMQPRRIKTQEAIQELKQYEADVYVVAAFGQILSQEILDMPRYGSLNIHASLLPKYRGASPIQHVIINGEQETGITIMQMDAGIDTGDMLYKKTIAIEDTDTYETLHDKLMVLGGEAIVEALTLLEDGELVPEKQDDSLSSHASLISKEMGRVDFTMEACAIERLIRGLNPWPSAYTAYKGKQLKIWAVSVEACKAGKCLADCANAADGTAECMEGVKDPVESEAAARSSEPGTVVEVTKNTIKVATGKGLLCINELQLEGKKRMSTHDFLLGVKVQPGDMLGV